MILADLSGKNPNVFYELGLAHALAKPAILVTESIDDIPFDLRALRVLEYDKNEPSWGTSLQEKIVKSIKEVTEAPLEAVLPAFLSVKSENKTKTISENEKQFLELRQEIELLRSEFRRSSVRPDFERGPRIPSSEARDRIRQLVDRGAPSGYIVERLRSFGVPSLFTRTEIDNVRRRKRPIPINTTRDEKGAAAEIESDKENKAPDKAPA